MSLSDVLREEAYQRLDFERVTYPLRGLEVWSLKSELPLIRNISLSDKELLSWLTETGDFVSPNEIRESGFESRLRLLYQCWNPSARITSGNNVPVSLEDWESIVQHLSLPWSYAIDLANRKHVPLRTVINENSSEPTISLVCQSPALLDSFMTLALTYDLRSKTTTGFLGLEMNKLDATPGHHFLLKIRDTARFIGDPMLLPALFFSIWTDILVREHRNVAVRLRDVQEKTGLMSDYLRQRQMIEDRVNFDSVHRTLVLHHAYLTNGIADFVTAMGPAIAKGIHNIDRYSKRKQVKTLLGPGFHFASQDTRQYVEHVQTGAQTELQHRLRMLDRISMYLQVLYNLMQQQIAKETKRDSSAMKSIALLTMVFLPAPAIATVISPFILVSREKIEMSSQFWIFWVISAPVTLIVVVLWFVWIQRVELMSHFERWRTKRLIETANRPKDVSLTTSHLPTTTNVQDR